MLKEKGRAATAKQEAVARQHEELQARYGLREPKPPTDYELFVLELEDDMRPFAKKLWRMGCVHKDEVIVEDGRDGVSIFIRCEVCGFQRRDLGTAVRNRKAEWMSYCPDGFDMFEWEDLYSRDKTFWPVLFEETLYVIEEGSGVNG